MRSRISGVILATLTVGGAACAPSAELRRGDLVGTVWRELCPDPTIAPAIVELRPDGLLGWSYAEPETLPRDGFRLDSVHTWTVADGALDIRWNLGSARSRYRSTGADGVLESESSTFCPSGTTLLRLDYSPNAFTSRSPRTVTDGTMIHGESRPTGDGL